MSNPTMIARAADLACTGTAIDIAHWLANNGLSDGDVTVTVDGVELDSSDLADTDDTDDIVRVIRITLGLD